MIIKKRVTEMVLPDKYAYGILFGCSGADGVNEHGQDFCGMLMPEPVTIRFDGETPVTLRIPVGAAAFDFILPDALRCGALTLAFADCRTVVGASALTPDISAPGARTDGFGDARFLSANGFVYALVRRGDRFAFCRERTGEEAVRRAMAALAQDLDALIEYRLDYYRRKPPCPRPEYEKLYYKCLAVNRVNVYSPQDGIDCRFTTPDRLPHRHMWLWDSMFHAMAIARYDPALAKEAVWAVLQCQRNDGFIPHLMKSRTDVSRITQPQVIAWALLTIWRLDGDREFLARCAGKTAAYLDWFLTNRDANGNGLPEWDMNFDSGHCRCDESGMDNSPRFDVDEPLDAVDCASFLAHDCRCMAEIWDILGEPEKRDRYAGVADETAKLVNDLLWDDALGAYCDRTLSGRLTGMLTVSSFLPMFAGICPPERAARLVRLLRDARKFATPLPVPSIARDDPLYGADMWRGCVWINYNYMIARGLRRSGYASDADALIETTLSCVNRIFERTGNIFEFYDAEDREIPWRLNRKGPQPETPDYRVKMHAITDYNWTASFLLLMLSGEK